MTTNQSAALPQSDPAAIFAAADSLWRECQRQVRSQPHLNLSASYQGMDSLMREVMRVATMFEKWSCQHVAFEELSEVWPYLLQDRFGYECLCVIRTEDLLDFDPHDCRRIAARLSLKLRQEI